MPSLMSDRMIAQENQAFLASFHYTKKAIF
jgi:hypothetical protein